MQMLMFTCLWIRYSIYVYHLVLLWRHGHSVEGQRSKKAMKQCIAQDSSERNFLVPGPLPSDTGQHCHERAKGRPFLGIRSHARDCHKVCVPIYGAHQSTVGSQGSADGQVLGLSSRVAYNYQLWKAALYRTPRRCQSQVRKYMSHRLQLATYVFLMSPDETTS